jgi:tetratricopeptide repeat protein
MKAQKYNFQLSAVIIAIMICFFSCKESPNTQKLLEIERNIDSKPEAMLDSLRGIDYGSLKTDRDKAMYGMLLAEASDKNYCLEGSDSLISFSVDYFERTDDQLRSLVSTYYYGRLLYNNQDYPRSIALFHAAKDMAEEQEEYFWAGMACRGISDIHNESYNVEEELKYARLEYENIKRSRRQPYINYALIDLARANISDNNFESALNITSEAQDSAKKYNDDYLYYCALRSNAFNYLTTENYDKAFDLYKKVSNEGYMTRNDSVYMALSCANTYKLNLALNIVHSMDNYDNPALLSLIKYTVYKHQDDLKKALNELEVKDSLRNIMFYTRINQDLTSSPIDYYQTKQENTKYELEIEKSKHSLILITCILVFVIILICVYVFISNQKKIIDNKVLIAEQLQESLTKSKNEESRTWSIIREILDSKYELFDNLCTIVVSSNNDKSTRRRIADAITNLIEDLSINGDKINDLECEINKMYDNLFTEFRNDFPDLKDKDYLLFLFVILHMSTSTISLLLKEDTLQSVYERKRRLKNKIKKSESPRCNKYLVFFEK